MPCEYVLSYENLTNFKIEIMTGDEKAITAFKDFNRKFRIYCKEISNWGSESISRKKFQAI
jgi:hypothetical protein